MSDSTTEKPKKSLEDTIKLARQWSPAGFLTTYNWLMHDAGESFGFPPHLFPLALALADTRIEKLMKIVGPGSGKSVLLSQVFPAICLGHKPSENVLCVSGAENLAQGFQNVFMGYIESNTAYRQIFPNVKPDKNRGWSTTSGAFVTGYRTSSPDASYWAAGLSSKALTGKHGTILIFDDLHDEENSATEEQCDGVVRKYAMQLTGRADPAGARFLMAGRRWHQNDLYGTLQKNGDWVSITLPAERPNSKTLWVDIIVPETIECVFTDGKIRAPDGTMTQVVHEYLPERIVRKEIIKHDDGDLVLLHIEWPYGEDPKGQGFYWPASKQKRSEYLSNKRLKPTETEAVYQCNPNARQGIVFLDSDFERRYEAPNGADLGIHSAEVRNFIGKGAMVIQSWDTAFSSNAASDYSVCVTLLLVPCEEYHRGEDPAILGPCDPHFDIYVLDVWRDRVSFAGVTQKMREMYQRWQPFCMVVEKKAYAVAAIEALENSGMPIEAVNPGPLESKRARAIEGVGAGSVQGWARQWRIRLPYDAPWVSEFVRELKDFTGIRGGVDDQVDALVHGVRWAIQNGGAAANLPPGWNSPEQTDKSMSTQYSNLDPLSALMSGIMATDIIDPFVGTCGHCRNYVKMIRSKNLKTNVNIANMPSDYCALHQHPTTALASCDDFSDPEEATSHPFFFANSMNRY